MPKQDKKKAPKSKAIAWFFVILGVLCLIGCLVWVLFFQGWMEFHENERKALEGAKIYMEHFPRDLPKEVGDYTRLKLEDLYYQQFTETLLIPGSDIETCSNDNSWIRVFKENENKYSYHVYLECGKYQSDIDHEGPEITLNGDNPYYVKRGETYTDPGIQSVIDNEDREIDVSKVMIDASRVNMNRVGTYEVVYSVYDEMMNRTDITRTVQVTRSLSDEITTSTGGSNVYRGSNVNNYVLFSGMLWRIIKINEDGTIKLMTENNISNLYYGNDESGFENSNVGKWLNNVFYNALSSKDWIKTDSTWCLDRVTDLNQASLTCTNGSNPMPVGMLTVAEFKDSIQDGLTYLHTSVVYRFLNKMNDTTSWIYNVTLNGDGTYQENDNTLIGVRPVINILPEEAHIISGDGSATSPYKLTDYEYGKDNDLLRDRLIGEYINYSGQVWRIAGFDDNQNIKITMTGGFFSDLEGDYRFGYDDVGQMKKFDPTDPTSIGYKVQERMNLYVDQSLLIEHEYERPQLDTTKNYTDVPKETFTAMFSIPATYDLFSGRQGSTGSYYLLDYSTNPLNIVFVNATNGVGFEIDSVSYNSIPVKLTTYLKRDTLIAGGRGTMANPYSVKGGSGQ